MCCVLELQFHDQSPVTDHLNFSGLAFGALHGMIEVRSSAIFFWDDDIGNLTDDVYLASLGNVRVSCPRWQHIAVQYHTSRMVELIFSPLSFSSWLTICLVTLVSLGPDHKALLLQVRRTCTIVYLLGLSLKALIYLQITLEITSLISYL